MNQAYIRAKAHDLVSELDNATAHMTPEQRAEVTELVKHTVQTMYLVAIDTVTGNGSDVLGALRFFGDKAEEYTEALSTIEA